MGVCRSQMQYKPSCDQNKPQQCYVFLRLSFLPWNTGSGISHSKSVRARSEPSGTWWRTVGKVKGKLANGLGSQYSHAISECGVSSITEADAHTSAASSRLNWRPHRFKWTRPFRRKTKSGFCACAIRFPTSYTNWTSHFHLYSVTGIT